MAYMNPNNPFGTSTTTTIPNTYPSYPPVQPIGGYTPPYTPNRSVLPGRTVSNVDEIAIGEVPQDGSIGIFPQSDGKIIWAKSWNSDGTIKTMKFVPADYNSAQQIPVNTQSNENEDNPTFIDMFNTISNIQDTIDLMAKELSIPTNQNGSNEKKENR